MSCSHGDLGFNYQSSLLVDSDQTHGDQYVHGSYHWMDVVTFSREDLTYAGSIAKDIIGVVGCVLCMVDQNRLQ